MTRKKLTLLFIVLYVISLSCCFFISRSYVKNKDIKLSKEAYNSLEVYFNGKDNLVNVVYSGEDVNYKRIQLPKSTDYIIYPKYPSDPLRSLREKDEYKWKKAYGDISKMYELIPKYYDDYTYTGFHFTVFENKRDHVLVYDLYPMYVGHIKQSNSYGYYMIPSIQQSVDECFDFYVSDKKSQYYGNFSSNNIFSTISEVVNNQYYHATIDTTKGPVFKSFGPEDYEWLKNKYKGDYFLGHHHSLQQYTIGNFNEFNKLGYYTYMYNGYYKVYLLANPKYCINITYRMGRNHPMLSDLIEFCVIGFIVISALTMILYLSSVRKLNS